LARRVRELAKSSHQEDLTFSIDAIDEDVTKFCVSLSRSNETPSAGLFLFSLTVPTDYQATPPSIKVPYRGLSPQYSRRICLDQLKGEWKTDYAPEKPVEFPGGLSSRSDVDLQASFDFGRP
jgi:ubiquitin-protein ligase